VFWNFEHTGPANSFDWWRGNHEWQSVVKPVMVGVHGNPISFDRDQLQIEESHGTPVEPLSLFEAQLCLRLGAVPKWLTDLAAGENIPGPR
jgi:hypothetical protein